MNKKNLVKIINKELTILSDFVEGFNENEKINPIEVDLALSKVKDIYDELLLLKEGESKVQDSIRDNSKNRKIEVEQLPVVDDIPVREPLKELIVEPLEPRLEVEVEKEVETLVPVIEEASTDNVVLGDPSLVEEPILPKVEEITESKIEPKVIEEPTVEEPPVKVPTLVDAPIEKPDAAKLDFIQDSEAVKPKNLKAEEKPKGEIIADKFSKDSLSINDMLAGVKKNKDLASLLKDSPIPDLKRAIKLNDRIWYINELFNKNGSTYENAVDVVNKSANLDLALEYLFTNFTWDQNRKSTISFLELVFRRFASN
jgi:hypothetical protein